MRTSFRLILISVGMVVLAGLARAGAQTLPSGGQVLVERAQYWQMQRRWDLAEQDWRQVLLSAPRQPDALAGLAWCEAYQGHRTRAEAALHALAQVDSASPALADVRALLRITPAQLQLLEQAGRRAAAHHPRQAMALYRQVFGDHPPAGVWGLAYEETLAALPDGYATAVAGLRDFARRYPGNEQYRLSLGRLLTFRPATRTEGMSLLAQIRAPRPLAEAARQAWRQALVWDQGSSDSLPWLQRYLHRNPDPKLQAWLDQDLRQQQASRQQQAQTAALQAGYRALEAGQIDRAEQEFSSLRQQTPQAGAPLAGLGFVALKRKDFKTAISRFEAALLHPAGDRKVLEQALEDARFWQAMSRGQAELKAGRPAAGLDQYQAALRINPGRPEALTAVGGLLLQLQRPAEAVPVYRRWTLLAPDTARAWKGLVLSLQQSGDAAAALTARKQMPAAVRDRLRGDTGLTAALAAAAVAAGDPRRATTLLQSVLRASLAAGHPAPLPVLLQLAGLQRVEGQTPAALDLYRQAIRDYPGHASAWEGLAAALHERHEDRQAMAALQSMPPAVENRAARSTGYLSLLAAIQAGGGQPAQAEATLQQALALVAPDSANGQKLRLQLGQLWLQQGRSAAALDLFRQTALDDQNSMGAWKGWVMALHAQGQDRQAIALTRRMPATVYAGLETDSGYLSALAAAWAAVGQTPVAIELLRHAAWNDQMRQTPVPAALEFQMAWLLMKSGKDADLYRLLTGLQARGDLTRPQQQSLRKIWVGWSLSQAKAASRSGHPGHAMAILQAAQQMWPDDADLRAGLAGMLLRQGQAEQAYHLYLPVSSQPTRLTDYQIAIGAALSAPDGHAQAERWISEAMRLWPQDARILNLAALGEEASGHHTQAVRLWKQALLQLPASPSPSSVPASFAPAPVASLQSLASLLLNRPAASLAPPDSTNSPSDPVAPPANSSPGLPSMEENVAPWSPGRPAPNQPPATAGSISRIMGAGFRTDSARDGYSPNNLSAGSGSFPPALIRVAAVNGPLSSSRSSLTMPATGSAAPPAPPAESPVISQEEQLRDQIEQSLADSQAGLSPYSEAAVRITSRSGLTGIDELSVQQSEWSTSLNLNDQFRLTVAALPMVLDAGTPTIQDANSLLGTLPLTDHGRVPVGAQQVSGLGAEIRLDGPSFFLKLGGTPQNFLVPNWTGSLWIHPSGPFSFGFDRTSVEDSLLSFAGMNDPGSGKVWGGVVANNVTLRGSWGTALSGFYSDVNLQTLHGLNVASNMRTAIDLGGWRRILDGPQGRVNLGFNFTTMHYQKNLDHFTFGQGGYFSPQRYVLASLPMEWHGRWKKNLGYEAQASLGWQSFSEDASPMFPLQASLGFLQSDIFPALTSSGLNYSLNLKGEYRWNSNWSAGAYLAMNNTRNYATQSLGLYLRYWLHPQPVEHGIVPDLPSPLLP